MLLLLLAGDYQQAMECYDKALLLNPRNCDAHVARGAAHANQGHFEAAVQDFAAALDIDPGNVNAAKYLQVGWHCKHITASLSYFNLLYMLHPTGSGNPNQEPTKGS
jgi:tetratricopeptide (TPR) repeat protein